MDDEAMTKALKEYKLSSLFDDLEEARGIAYSAA
jgi:hypothetical protein